MERQQSVGHRTVLVDNSIGGSKVVDPELHGRELSGSKVERQTERRDHALTDIACIEAVEELHLLVLLSTAFGELMLAAGIVVIGLVGYGKLVHAPFLVIELIALWLVGSGEDDHCRQSVDRCVAGRQIVRVVSPRPDILSIEFGLRHGRFFAPIAAGEIAGVVPCPQMRFIPSYGVVEIYGELDFLLVVAV